MKAFVKGFCDCFRFLFFFLASASGARFGEGHETTERPYCEEDTTSTMVTNKLFLSLGPSPGQVIVNGLSSVN